MKYCPKCNQPGDGAFCIHCGTQLFTTQDNLGMSSGTVLEGTLYTYQLQKVLGQGGFGITYRALNRERGELVAVKEYFPVRSAVRAQDGTVQVKPGYEEEFKTGLESFSGEARMLATMDKVPSVVQVMDQFQKRGTAYLVMEYLDGTPLHEKAARMGGKIPPEELLPKLPPLLRDLAVIHKLGVLHRDITPDNIMWMPDGTLKLLDFGSARNVGGGNSMTVLLKQGFAPVEQYLTGGQGSYTDVYALCATIYFLLTGVMPTSALERLEHDDLQPPSHYCQGLTPQQDGAILRGMRVQPKERTQTVEELARDLDIQEPRPEPVKPTARKPWKWVAAGVAALALVIVAAVALGSKEDTPKGEAWIHSTKPSQTQTETTQPTTTQPTTTPPTQTEPQEQVSEEGLVYLAGEKGITIVGFEGTLDADGTLFVPDTIDNQEVTEIAAGAFSGHKELQQVWLPYTCTVIGDGAFEDCPGLRQVSTFATLASVGEDCFSGCDALRAVYAMEPEDFRQVLPQECRAYPFEMETGVGALSFVMVDELGVVYGFLEDDSCVLLDVPANLEELNLSDTPSGENTVYICEGALDNATSLRSLTLGNDTIFPFGLFDQVRGVDSVYCQNNSLAQSWFFSCYGAAYLNILREQEGGDYIYPDVNAVKAAMVRAQELVESYEHTRPDGTEWSSVLKENSVDWSYAHEVIATLDEGASRVDKINEMAEYILEREPESGDEYYSLLGLGLYYGETVRLNLLGIIP